MILNLTKREYIKLHEWHIHLREYSTCKFDKILYFHGNEDGDFDVSKLILYFYYLLGYKFISCYPIKVRQTLGFGQFLWPDCNEKITVNIEADEDGNFLVNINMPN